MSTVPAAIDIARKACQATAEACGIRPVKVSELSEPVREKIEAAFPASVVEQANLYFDMPLNDPQMGIGFLNTLGMIAAGGGTVMGMTFGNDVYLDCGRDDLLESAEARSLVGHELVHVAQYQALGFGPYKEMYAKETARKSSYEENALEKEAFRFQSLTATRPDRAFFAFYRSTEAERVCVEGRPGATLDSLTGIDSVEVAITAADEILPRTVTLVLGSTDPATGRIAPQMLDPHGGEPLYILEAAGPVRVLANVPAADGGPALVALATGDALEVVWRDGGAFHSQRFPAGARLEDTDGDGSMEVVESGAVVPSWGWNGTSFERR